MKPNLFFDFDNTKFNTTPALMLYINQRWNINSIESDYIGKNDDLELVVGKYRTDIEINRNEVYEDLGRDYNKSIVRQKDVPSIKNMRRVIKLLSKKYTLWTVTARQKEGMHVIKYLLDKHIPGCISGIHCVWERKASGISIETSKKDFIESISGEKVAFIDDSPKEILKMQSIIPSYLFDPSKLHENLTGINNRIYSWNEIGKKFL